jgi:tRNA threonylcarbamoyladenosine biosynthesis protein TsaE
MIELGKELADQLDPGAVVGFFGDLGAGKTTLIQGIALGLGIQEPVQSPTFTYLQAYEGRCPLFHFDLYRMKGEKDFLGMGFDECFDAKGICAVEWPERISSLLPSNALRISISHHAKGRLVEGLP